MKLHVYVRDQPVATLESADGFRHVMAYHPDAAPDQFVSLLMDGQESGAGVDRLAGTL